MWGIGFEVLFAAALIYLPPLQPLFGTAPLAWTWWVALGCCAPGILLAEELRKWVVRKRSLQLPARVGPSA